MIIRTISKNNKFFIKIKLMFLRFSEKRKKKIVKNIPRINSWYSVFLPNC